MKTEYINEKDGKMLTILSDGYEAIGAEIKDNDGSYPISTGDALNLFKYWNDFGKISETRLA